SSPTTLPPARSHTCALPNSIAVRIRIPSALNVTLTSRRVGNVFPPGATLSSRTGLPLATFHTRTVPSDDAVRTRPPSGLNATRLTGPSCLSSCSSSPLPAFHTRAVPSAEPLTTCVPSALNATLLTALVCPERTRCRRLTCAAPASFASKPVTSWVDQPRASGERPGGGRPCTAIRIAASYFLSAIARSAALVSTSVSRRSVSRCCHSTYAAPAQTSNATPPSAQA